MKVINHEFLFSAICPGQEQDYLLALEMNMYPTSLDLHDLEKVEYIEPVTPANLIAKEYSTNEKVERIDGKYFNWLTTYRIRGGQRGCRVRSDKIGREKGGLRKLQNKEWSSILWANSSWEVHGKSIKEWQFKIKVCNLKVET